MWRERKEKEKEVEVRRREERSIIEMGRDSANEDKTEKERDRGNK